MTDGTGLIGDALTDAYTQAADKAQRGETGARSVRFLATPSWRPFAEKNTFSLVGFKRSLSPLEIRLFFLLGLDQMEGWLPFFPLKPSNLKLFWGDPLIWVRVKQVPCLRLV